MKPRAVASDLLVLSAEIIAVKAQQTAATRMGALQGWMSLIVLLYGNL